VINTGNWTPEFESLVLNTTVAGFFYGSVSLAVTPPQVKFSTVLTDLNNADYRDWAMAYVLEMLEYLDVDGLVLAVKSGWHAYYDGSAGPEGPPGSNCSNTYAPIAPSSPTGSLSCTPYLQGEFEAGMGSYIEALEAAGVPIITNEAPHLGIRGQWYSQYQINAIVGERAVADIPASLVQCAVRAAQCADGLDNDGDGNVDFSQDLGCSDAADDSERGPHPCDNGVDDDHDGSTDFPHDLDCSSPQSDGEISSVPSLGPAARAVIVVMLIVANSRFIFPLACERQSAPNIATMGQRDRSG